MPYTANDELPPAVRDHLPPHAQDIFREAFDHAWEEVPAATKSGHSVSPGLR